MHECCAFIICEKKVAITLCGRSYGGYPCKAIDVKMQEKDDTVTFLLEVPKQQKNPICTLIMLRNLQHIACM